MPELRCVGYPKGLGGKMKDIPAQWEIPVRVLLRGLDEEGRLAPEVVEVDKDGSVSMGWPAGDTGGWLLLSLRPELIAISVPSKHHDRWVPLGADWMSEVRRLVPKKPAPSDFDDEPTLPWRQVDSIDEGFEIELVTCEQRISDALCGKPVERLTVAADLTCLSLEVARRQLGERADWLWFHYSDREYVTKASDVLRDALGADGSTCIMVVGASDMLNEDEWVLAGPTRAVYSPGA